MTLTDLLTNDELSQKLRAHAADLARRGESLYRVRAFRQAAMAVLMLPTEAAELYARRGRRGLEATPGIGRSVSAAVVELLDGGDLADLGGSVAGEFLTGLAACGR